MKYGLNCNLCPWLIAFLVAIPAFCQNKTLVWGSISSPNNGDRQNEFRGIAPVSSNDVWAVGDYNSGVIPTVTGRRTLIEHWDGQTWSIVPSTQLDLPNFDAVYLEDALALASNDVWAVGHADDFSSLNSATLIAHFDGTNWSLIPSPNPSGNSLPDGLFAIARAGNRLYAVGQTGYPERSLIVTWNGVNWLPVPNNCKGPLVGVSAASASLVFAAGYLSACRFDGTSWENLPLPPLESGETYALQNVAALSPTDAWLVGAIVIPQSGGEGGGYTFKSVALRGAALERLVLDNLPADRGSTIVWSSATVID